MTVYTDSLYVHDGYQFLCRLGYIPAHRKHMDAWHKIWDCGQQLSTRSRYSKWRLMSTFKMQRALKKTG